MTDEIAVPPNETGASLPESSAMSPEGQQEPAKKPPMNLRDQMAMRGRRAALLVKQRRDRRILVTINVLTTFLFMGALCGWGPIQLMVSEYLDNCSSTDVALKHHSRTAVSSS